MKYRIGIRGKLKKAVNNKEYNIILKNSTVDCQICAKRGGSYKSSCHPSANNPRGYRWRANKTWKRHRKTQYKT
jgi:hypothetical protein